MTDTPVRLSMFARSESGEIISRTRKCKNGHQFQQNQINKEWLATKSDGARSLYERDYETDVRNGSQWMPSVCHQCRGRIK